MFGDLAGSVTLDAGLKARRYYGEERPVSEGPPYT